MTEHGATTEPVAMTEPGSRSERGLQRGEMSITRDELERGRRRLRLLGAAFALGFAVVAWRLLDLVPWHSNGSEISAAMLAPPAAAGPVPRLDARRDIARYDITDRNGVLLATNLRVPSVYADPSVIQDKKAAAQALARALGDVDPRALRTRLETGKHFAWVKHRVTPQEQRAVLELGIPGVGFDEAVEHRVYPKGNLVSHVVGFVDLDNRGLVGIERGLEERLIGTSGRGDTALSIDVNIQEVVRDELARAAERFQAKGAVGLVLDRASGEVLSLVSLPDFDPNRPDVAGENQRLNRATGATYELGSLFKAVSTAMALDGGKVAIGDQFDATKPLQFGRFKIRDDHAKSRVLAVPECFMYSSNICTARIAEQAGGAPVMDGFFKKVGFYDRLPLELPTPEVGKPQKPSRWSSITVATTSFGHGIAVSPLQFMSVLGGILGDGTMAPTTLLRRDLREPVNRTRLVSQKTAEELNWLMWLTVARGTGNMGANKAYLVGGKTGTADKVNPQGGGYFKDRVIASFAGVFPLDDPRYLVLALLDDPRGDAQVHGFRYGGWTTAPIVAGIIDRIGPLLTVGQSDQRLADGYRDQWRTVMNEPLEGEGNDEAALAH